MIIYKATNKINRKGYVGQTIHDINYRRREHIYQSKKGTTYFNRAIKKYGPDNFKWEVIDECNNINRLNQLEIFYIGYYDTFGKNGYNLTTGGDGASGCKHGEEFKKKMSNIAKIRPPMSEETKKKISNSLKGSIPWNKGKKCPQLAGDNHWLYKGKVSNETRKKQSNSHKRHIVSLETRKKLSIINKGKILSEYHKKKIGKSNKGKKQSEETIFKRKRLLINYYQIKRQIDNMMLQFL